MPRNSVVRLTDLPDMTKAVLFTVGVKQQKNNNNNNNKKHNFIM